MGSSDWVELRERMQGSLIVVCEAGASWLTDDGVRLMPASVDEWKAFHDLFCRILSRMGLDFGVLSNSVADLGDRVKFVTMAISGRQLLSMYCCCMLHPPRCRLHPQSIYISHPVPHLQPSRPTGQAVNTLCALPPNHLNLVPKKMISLHARRLARRHARDGRDADLGVDVEHAARAARRPQARGGVPAVVAEVEAVERAVKVELLGLLCVLVAVSPPPLLSVLEIDWQNEPAPCCPKSNTSSWKSPRPPAPAPRARSSRPR